MLATFPSPQLGHERAASTDYLRYGKKKRKLSNKWFLDGSQVESYVYSDLPIQGPATVDKSHGHITNGGSAGLLSLVSVSESQGTDQSSRYSISPQYMNSPPSLACDSEEHLSSDSSVVTAISRSSLDCAESCPTGSTLLTTREREPRQEFSKIRAPGFSRRYDTSPLSEPRTPMSPSGFTKNYSATEPKSASEMWEPATLLWPLPPGDPLLPPDLQAVPYPTAPEVRPPLSPILEQHPDRGPHLPSISQLIVGAAPDGAMSPDPALCCSTARFNDDDSDEGYEESSGLPALNQPVTFDPTPSHTLQALSSGDGRYGSSREMPFGTHLEPDEGWRLGFMRLHRERKPQASQRGNASGHS